MADLGLTPDELKAMTLAEVEELGDKLPTWPHRGVWDWLWGRGQAWGPDESFGDLFRRLAKRMRDLDARHVNDLGDEVDQEWHPRLMTHYAERERLGLPPLDVLP